MFVSLQDIAPESSRLKGVSLKDYKIVSKINVREMKTKLYWETLIILWIKWAVMVEIKYRDLIDVTPKVQHIQGLH